MSKSLGRSTRRLWLLAACAILLLAHGASSVVSVQSGDVRLVGKTRYLNNARSAVTHTVDDSTKHVPAVIDALDKYGVKGTLFISTEQDPPVEERFFTQLQVWQLWPRLEKAIEDGHELGSHARTHPCRRPDTVPKGCEGWGTRRDRDARHPPLVRRRAADVCGRLLARAAG